LTFPDAKPATRLTTQFRDWWKQGEYRFRFEADGNHFRIWVSDDKRPEEIELEGRSTGLQWFLSVYLVFLVERADAHDDAILLLDEPGLSLHPLAQRDLSEFFEGLAKDNQLLCTCHSPFLVDADRLDRARKVFVDANGTSTVTSDLREGDGTQRGAAYAVYAPVGLSVSKACFSAVIRAGRETVKSLRANLHAGNPDLVMEVGPFVGMAGRRADDLDGQNACGRHRAERRRGSDRNRDPRQLRPETRPGRGVRNARVQAPDERGAVIR
jgi:hypothetical protein